MAYSRGIVEMERALRKIRDDCSVPDWARSAAGCALKDRAKGKRKQAEETRSKRAKIIAVQRKIDEAYARLMDGERYPLKREER